MPDTSARTTPFPEEILVAVLHKVGKGVRILDDRRLAEIFVNAGKQHGRVFARFVWHRQYRYSKLLSETLQVLDLGGSIVRENAASTYFGITEHMAGPFGAKTFDQLNAEEKKVVSSIAQQVISEFKDGG